MLGCGVKITFVFVALFLFLSFTFGQDQVPTLPATIHQGFGAKTRGGPRGNIVHVTNLNDSGPGSFRNAVSQGNRTVVFDVAGEIVVNTKNNKYIPVMGAFVTIDGSTAPPPGITIKNGGIQISGKHGAHDVIVKGIRIRNAPRDGIQISNRAYNVVIDHVSIYGSGDGNLDVTQGVRDVTVSWSIFAEPGSGKTMLIKYNPARITLHHNLFVRGTTRNPQVSVDNVGTSPTDTALDMRNNLVWDWGPGYGTLIRNGARANIVNNFYSSNGGDKEDALIVCSGKNLNPKHERECSGGDPRSHARAYVQGNLSADDLARDINSVGNETHPFPAPFGLRQDACSAAHEVLSGAGVRPLDLVDQRFVSMVSLPLCSG